MSAKNKKRAAAVPVENKRVWRVAALSFLSRRSRAIALLAVVIASLRIAATYPVFNQTFDEPLHIGCGLKWLAGVVCADETPPLGRVAEAIGPYLLGARAQSTPYSYMEGEYAAGADILYQSGDYDLTLSAARLGNLAFFWIACLAIYLWGKRYYGPAVAAVAVLLFSLLPPVLAHAGVATVDMALTALLAMAVFSALAWIEQPDWAHGIGFGAITALAILAKYSALVFLPSVAALALVAYAIAEWPGALARGVWKRIPSFAAALVTIIVLVWVGFRFSYGPTYLGAFRLPAPQLFAGLKMVADHNRDGHYAYLLGARSTGGWWYFYPVVLAVKTPLAFLALTICGVMVALREPRSRAWLPLAFSGGILIVGLFSHINIGVRHILPIYIGFALLAAIAVVRILETEERTPWPRTALAILLLWMTVSSLLSHPDYLAYFNELAGSKPENVLLDSDLDWGQDMKRLAKRLRDVGAPSVTFTPLSDADLPHALGFPPVRPSSVPIPSPGWNAVSLTQWKSRRLRLLNTHPEVIPWPDLAPPGERIGRGIMLWYFPPGSVPGR